MRKIAYLLTAATAVLGLALAGASAAGASTATAHPHGVSSVLRFTDAGTSGTVDPVAGYFASTDGDGYFTHISGYIGSNDSDSLNQLAASPANGGGLGLCNQSTGDAIQSGDVYLGNGLMDVDYGKGVLHTSKSPAGFGTTDPCADGTVGVTGSPLLSDVAITDTIVGQVLYNPFDAHNGCRAGYAIFAVEDLTANPGVWSDSPCVPVGFGLKFDEADAGVVADTTSMSVPATNLLIVFAHLGLSENLNGGGTVHGSFQANSTWTAFGIDSTGTGNGPASAALLSVTPFAADHFDINAGTPTG